MRTIRNKHIPFRGFQAINLFGLVFVRKEHFPLSETSINHEKIHTRQMQELAFLPFYLFYILEWLIKSTQHRNFRQGYLSISFEREAYSNQENFSYLENRKWWNFVNYL
jgi:hypothetical protein